MANEAKKETDTDKKVPEKELYKWTASARPFKRRDREFWVTVLAIVAISALVLFLTEGVMPVMLLISLVFLFYILTTVEPDQIEYKITNRGIKIADKTTIWKDIKRFWFSKRFDSRLMILDLYMFPGRLELVVLEKDIDKLKKIMKEYVDEEEAPPSYMDRLAVWFSKKLPGNA